MFFSTLPIQKASDQVALIEVVAYHRLNPAFPDVKVTYDTDDVTNYEFGWKAMFLENTLRFNGNVYFIEWDDMQVSRFDPVNVSILTFIENAADSEITGFEVM